MSGIVQALLAAHEYFDVLAPLGRLDSDRAYALVKGVRVQHPELPQVAGVAQVFLTCCGVLRGSDVVDLQAPGECAVGVLVAYRYRPVQLAFGQWR